MSRVFLDVLVLTAVCLSWFHGLGSALKIDINPSKAHRLVYHEVDIYCKLEKSDSDIKEVIILELAKGDKPIAIIRQNSKLTIGRGLQSKFKAQGRLSTNLLDNYLHVTLSNPDANDAGAYSCNFYFMNELTLVKESIKSADLSVVGSSLNIDITPNKANKLVHYEVNIHCNMEYSGKDVTQITSLEVTRDGDTIAVIDEDSHINIGDGMESKFKAEGKLSAPPMESYLHLTLSNPDAKDSGRYTCLVYYVDEMSRAKESSKSDNLTVVDDDPKSALNVLVDTISHLKDIHRFDVEQLMKEMDKERNESKVNEILISNLKTELNHHKNADERAELMKELERQVNESMANDIVISSLKKELNEQTRIHSNDVSKIREKLNRHKEESKSNEGRISRLNKEISEQETVHEDDVAQIEKEIKTQMNELVAARKFISTLNKTFDRQKSVHVKYMADVRKELHRRSLNSSSTLERFNVLKKELNEGYDVLKSDVDQLKKELDRQKNVLKVKETDLEGRITKLAGELKSQEVQLENDCQRLSQLNETDLTTMNSVLQLQQSTQMIDDVIDKESRTILFRAEHTGRGDFGKDHDLVFSNVLVNEEGAYDATTGKFTAPLAGYYIFAVSVAANDDKYMYMDLQSSNGQVLTSLYSGEKNGFVEYSDTSVVVKLEAGEKVWPVIREVSSGFNLRIHYDYDHYGLNKFNGYLLKAL